MDGRYFEHRVGGRIKTSLSRITDEELFERHSLAVCRVSLAEELLDQASIHLCSALALCNQAGLTSEPKSLGGFGSELAQAESEFKSALNDRQALRAEINRRYPDFEEN